MTKVTDGVHYCGKLIVRTNEGGKRQRSRCNDTATSAVKPYGNVPRKETMLCELDEYDFRCWRHVGLLSNGRKGEIIDEYIDRSPATVRPEPEPHQTFWQTLFSKNR